MTLNRKYSGLPDLDTAPDIYETPELTDDNSTVPPTTLRSPSESELIDDEESSHGILRSRLRIDEARSHFMPAAVDARDVDFSDRITSKRKSYKTSTYRQRVLEDGTEEYGDLSDEEGGEHLERRIARLRREIEEVKEECGKQKAAEQEAGNDAATGASDQDIVSLSEALQALTKLSANVQTTPRPISHEPSAEVNNLAPSMATGESTTYTITYAPSYEQTHALAKAADFDHRLAVLEKALGIGSSALPELESASLSWAIIPSLNTLQKQITTLSETSTSSLDSISRRVRALIQETDNLEKSRRNAKVAQEALESTGVVPLEGAAAEDVEQMAKINALYGTLPTIESLTPLLPPLLDRLRSLRVIHADAAAAKETLDRIEQKQAGMASEIRQWQEGLDKIETSMKEGDTALTSNTKILEGWVKDLEEKLSRLG